MLMFRKGVYDSLPDEDRFHVPAYYSRKKGSISAGGPSSASSSLSSQLVSLTICRREMVVDKRS